MRMHKKKVKDHVKSGGEDSYLQAKKRGLRKNSPIDTLILEF